MEIEVKQEKLAKALNTVSKIATGSRTTLPILSNVLIRVDDKKVSLTTTNLDMAIVDYLPVANSSNGVITVPARLLADFISNLPRGEMVKIISNNVKVKISSGKYSSVINGALADEFPELPQIDEKQAVIYKMGIDEFKNGINSVITASSNDTTRPALTGVYFNTFENKLYVAATDGYRLAERLFINKIQSEVKAIVPTQSLQEVMRSISDDVTDIEILFDDTQVRFRMGEIELTSKLIDASFPDYRQLIPKNNEIKVTLSRSELIRVTKLAALFAREVGGSIVCESKKEAGVFSVASITNEFGENDSEIETAIDEDGRIVLNSRFLNDALNVLEEEKIVFEFSSKSRLSPVLLHNEKSDHYLHIIMPLDS